MGSAIIWRKTLNVVMLSLTGMRALAGFRVVSDSRMSCVERRNFASLEFLHEPPSPLAKPVEELPTPLWAPETSDVRGADRISSGLTCRGVSGGIWRATLPHSSCATQRIY